MNITIDKNQISLSFSEMKARRTWISGNKPITTALGMYYVAGSLCVKLKDIEQYVPICWYYSAHLALDAKALRLMIKLQEKVNKSYRDYVFESITLSDEVHSER